MILWVYNKTVYFSLNLKKPPLPTKVISYRKLKSIEISKFRSDIIDSGLPSLEGDLDTLVSSYNEKLSSILDKHAPLKAKKITIHPDAKWINSDVRLAKSDKRKAERKWRNTQLEVHRQIYVEKRDEFNKVVNNSKRNHIQETIIESSNEQGALFKTMDKLFYKTKASALPSHEDAEELCNRMADFFSEKIKRIHEGLAELQRQPFQLDEDAEFPTHSSCFNEFTPVTEADIEKIIKQSASKSCCLDPIPTQLLKQCLDILVPIITRIVNQSFTTATVPTSFKIAAITPILKKANLIAEILKNFRPISNLPYVSKVLEKVASKQLLAHKDVNGLREKFQSAYREFHSTETALLRINHDLLQAMDEKKCVMMCMLDLSAAFDTVNHEKLLNRMSTSL